LLIGYKPGPQDATITDPILLISKKGSSDINKTAEKYKKRPNKFKQNKSQRTSKKKTFVHQTTPFSYHKTYLTGISHISF